MISVSPESLTSAMLDYLLWHKPVLSCLSVVLVFTVQLLDLLLGFHSHSETKQEPRLISASSCSHAAENLSFQLVIDQFAHPTFLIKFQVNWLWSNVPEAERQSGSEDDPQLPVCEPQQQEKGEAHGLLSALSSTHYSLCGRAALVCCSCQATDCEMSFTADCADVWLVVLGCQEDAQNRTDCLFTCSFH